MAGRANRSLPDDPRDDGPPDNQDLHRSAQHDQARWNQGQGARRAQQTERLSRQHRAAGQRAAYEIYRYRSRTGDYSKDRLTTNSRDDVFHVRLEPVSRRS